MNESALLIKSTFQNDSVKMGIESKEVAGRLISQHSSGLDILARSLVVEVCEHPEDEPADFGEQVAVMTEEGTLKFWKSPDELPVGKKEQQLFMHILSRTTGSSSVNKKGTSKNPYN